MINSNSLPVIAFIVFTIMFLILSALFMLIWNNVLMRKVPSLQLQELSYVDAMALLFLFLLLFKGISIPH